MDKKDEVIQILSSISDLLDDIVDDPETAGMSAEELVILATEMVINSPVTTIEYSSPVGTVDRERVTFVLDDEFEFPLFGDVYYEEK